jgi:hypothetical protein
MKGRVRSLDPLGVEPSAGRLQSVPVPRLLGPALSLGSAAWCVPTLGIEPRWPALQAGAWTTIAKSAQQRRSESNRAPELQRLCCPPGRTAGFEWRAAGGKTLLVSLKRRVLCHRAKDPDTPFRFSKNKAPGRARTDDLRFTKPALLPAELLRRAGGETTQAAEA